MARPAKGWSREKGWVEVATLGLVRGHAQPHHTHQVLENHLASSPGCRPWLEVGVLELSRACGRWKLVGSRKHVSSQQMAGRSL